jgi:hypothetical protein
LIERIHRGVMRLLRHHLFLVKVYVRDLHTERKPDSPPGFSARFATREELMTAAQNPGLQLEPESIDRALGRGDLCVAAFHGDDLVAYLWRSTTQAPHNDRIWVETRKPYRYGYKSLTLEAYRGQHIPEWLAPTGSDVFTEQGYTWSIGFVETRNFSSRRSEARRGSIAIGHAGYLRLFGKIIPFRTPAVRRAGFRFFVVD